MLKEKHGFSWGSIWRALILHILSKGTLQSQAEGISPQSWFSCSVPSAFESTVERQVVFPLNLGACLTMKRDVVWGRKKKPRRKRGYDQPCREDNRRSFVQTHHCISYRDLAQRAEIRNNKCARTCHLQEHLALPDAAASTLYPSQLPALLLEVFAKRTCGFCKLVFPLFPLPATKSSFALSERRWEAADCPSWRPPS